MQVSNLLLNSFSRTYIYSFPASVSTYLNKFAKKEKTIQIFPRVIISKVIVIYFNDMINKKKRSEKDGISRRFQGYWVYLIRFIFRLFYTFFFNNEMNITGEQRARKNKFLLDANSKFFESYAISNEKNITNIISRYNSSI
jgi:hypothetical protein